MNQLLWSGRLRELFFQALTKYQSGYREAERFFSTEETADLARLGLRPIHVYDFVEDMHSTPQMSWEDFLLIASARRDYFLYMQGGVWPAAYVPERELPRREETWQGLAWLPRITAKAQCFLQGTLDPSVMYFCGGDRQFLSSVGLPPADFLRAVWAARGELERVGQFVRDYGQPASVRAEPAPRS